MHELLMIITNGGILISSNNKKSKKNSKKSTNKNNNDFPNKSFSKINKRLKLVMVLQIIFIILLILNFLLIYFNFTREGAVINAGDGIELDLSSVNQNISTYEVLIHLKNTGDTTAKVSITGVVYISEMGSAYGEEVTTILDYKYIEIASGDTKDLNLGTFDAYENWHYYIKVHVSWNGGSLELGKLLIP